MKTVFKLKVLTPMFMGGADPRGEPELRAASIRGAMRFWFRAIVGAVTSDPREIYRLESEVFGNTEKRSKVVVRITQQPRIEEFDKCLDKRSVSYIGYGLYESRDEPARKCLMGNAQFELDFPSDFQKLMGYILWFIQNVGGLGARSRKGFGSVKIIALNDKIINDILKISPDQFLACSNLKRCLKEALKGLKNDFDFVTQSMHPSLSPKMFNFSLVSTNEDSFCYLLQRINKNYRNFRRNLSKRQRKYLGFSGKDRRSSPLFIRPVKLKDEGPFKVVLFLFKSRFHPEMPDPEFDELFEGIKSAFENARRHRYV